uniref:Uncharacterized protein n=1 Tax=Anguilla anguilla TaxID=7936 RepID=A0A0E9SL88_ANGAN
MNSDLRRIPMNQSSGIHPRGRGHSQSVALGTT